MRYRRISRRLGENVQPPYYFTPDLLHPLKPTNSCNPNGEEDFESSPEGLDNDGDLLYDLADPDCLTRRRPRPHRGAAPTATPTTPTDPDGDGDRDLDAVTRPNPGQGLAEVSGRDRQERGRSCRRRRRRSRSARTAS